MNIVVLVGRITKDLELRTTNSGKDICNYSLAVQVDKDTTNFFDCTTFGESAKALCNYCKKGDLISVTGQLRTSQYVDKNNVKHNNVYVLTNKITFLANKKNEEKKDQPVTKSVEKSTVEINEDMLPF